MKKIEACFVCTTPYQILGAISIVQEKKIESDIYVFATFNNAEDVISVLRSYNIFRRVFLIDYQQFRNLNICRLIYQNVFSKRIARKILSKDACYDNFYSTSREHYIFFILYELRRRNRCMRCVYYEDGIGSFGKMPALIKRKYRDVYEILIGHNSMHPNKTLILSSCPALIELPPKWASIPIGRMPILSQTKANTEMISNIFSYNTRNKIDEKIILFDTCWREQDVNSDMFKRMYHCYNHIISICGRNDILCKPHPRTTYKNGIDFKEFAHQETPWEVVCFSLENIENRLLMGILSTAQFTPKLLFGKEPFVISLHKIAGLDNPIYTDIYEKLFSLYDNKNKVFAPNSIGELEEALKKIMNKH